MLGPLQSLSDIVGRALDAFVDDLTAALPKIIAGVVFLVLAYVIVRSVMFVVRAVVRRTFRGDEPVYQQFVVTIVAVFLWFGVALSFLSIVGQDDIAGRVREALRAVVTEGDARTRDMGGEAGTEEYADAVLRRLVEEG